MEMKMVTIITDHRGGPMRILTDLFNQEIVTELGSMETLMVGLWDLSPD